jgi:hypothetical protein
MKNWNWRTNSVGIAALVLAIATIWGPPSIQQKLRDTQNQLPELASLLGVGFLVSKDNNK